MNLRALKGHHVLVVLVTLAALAAVWFFMIGADRTRAPLSDDEWRRLLRATWDAVKAGREVALPPDGALVGKATMLVSTSDGESAASVAVGEGYDVPSAVNEALRKLVGKPGAGASLKWLKLHLVRATFEPVKVEGKQDLERERSLYGLGVHGSSELRFAPEEVVTKTLVDSDGEVTWKNLAQRSHRNGVTTTQDLRVLEAQASLESGTLVQFEADAWFMDETAMFPTYRGHRIYGEVTPDSLRGPLALAGDYLVRMVRGDGSFVYTYRPKTDEVGKSYNILRHAGAIYSMMELHAVFPKPELRAAAESAISYLLGTVKSCVSPDPEAACVVEDGQAKLGGNGLAIVALAKHAEVTGTRDHLETMRRLARRLTSVQDARGEFKAHKQAMPSGQISDFVSGYYPGEAILALMRLYRIDGDQAWVDAAARAARFLVQIRDGGKPADKLDHDHWLLYGLNELYRVKPDPAFMGHAKRIVDAILSAQQTQSPYPDFVGGFADVPRTTPTATRAEGLMAAYRLFKDYGETEWAERTLAGARLAAGMQLAAQHRPETAMYLPKPMRALGGFGERLTNYEVRIDYVQHNISALLALFQELGGRQ